MAAARRGSHHRAGKLARVGGLARASHTTVQDAGDLMAWVDLTLKPTPVGKEGAFAASQVPPWAFQPARMRARTPDGSRRRPAAHAGACVANLNWARAPRGRFSARDLTFNQYGGRTAFRRSPRRGGHFPVLCRWILHRTRFAPMLIACVIRSMLKSPSTISAICDIITTYFRREVRRNHDIAAAAGRLAEHDSTIGIHSITQGDRWVIRPGCPRGSRGGWFPRFLRGLR